MSDNQDLHPFLKWPGGKRQLLPILADYIPTEFKSYYEPFVGAGAMLFYLRPEIAYINDINVELMNCFEVVRDNVEDLIADLKKHFNTESYYYLIRSLDRTPYFRSGQLSEVARASRIIYLNKTCFNGLYRENSKGEFNAPFGRYAKPKICDETTLRMVHQYLQSAKIQISCCDFETAVSTAREGDFVYFDPPYVPVSRTASFTNYSPGGFNLEDHFRLKNTVDFLTNRGVKVLLTNSDTDFARDLYRDYYKDNVQALRAINSKGSKRGPVNELIIANYDPVTEVLLEVM
jgi:DNA adenine methylase